MSDEFFDRETAESWFKDNEWTLPRNREDLDRPEWAYNEDHYCVACGNGNWKAHAPWCEIAHLFDQLELNGMTEAYWQPGMMGAFDETDA